MFKNISPQRLTILMSAIVSLVSSFITALYFVFSKSDVNPLLYAVLLIGTFVVSYLVIRYLLQKYIYRRIKPIYKIIRRSKMDKQTKISLEDYKGNFLGNLDAEVTQWMDSTKQEISTLKSLEEYRKNYVGNISHELKTPLFSIQGYLQTLLDEIDENTQENHAYFIKRASANVERLITIVQDLDTITKLEAGKTPMDIQAFSIKELVEEVIQDLEWQSKEKNIEIGFKDGANKSFVVNGDRENIRTVITNLILNSIKYGRQNGRTKIGFYDMHNYILVEVSDNGIGVDEKHLNHLFDRFYRVDKSRSRAGGGSGLGLSIVKHIIEAHGQDLNVRSTVGKGTTFGFTLAKNG